MLNEFAKRFKWGDLETLGADHNEWVQWSLTVVRGKKEVLPQTARGTTSNDKTGKNKDKQSWPVTFKYKSLWTHVSVSVWENVCVCVGEIFYKLGL